MNNCNSALLGRNQHIHQKTYAAGCGINFVGYSLIILGSQANEAGEHNKGKKGKQFFHVEGFCGQNSSFAFKKTNQKANV